MKVGRKKGIGVNIIIESVLVITVIVLLFPVLFMVINSFLGSKEILSSYGGILSGSNLQVHFHLIPEEATLEGYGEVFLMTPAYLIKFWSSLFLSVSIVLGQVMVSCISGYGLAKFHFPMKNEIFYLVIILMMMPTQVLMVSQYPVLSSMGLIGSYFALILPGAFAAFGIFLMTQVFSYVPNEILEAAKIDGAGHFQILLRIMIPCSNMGIASLVILSFIDNWNMVEQPIVFLKESYQYPLSVFLSSINTNRLDLAFVCGVLTIVPAMILYLFLKDALILGIENASFK